MLTEALSRRSTMPLSVAPYSLGMLQAIEVLMRSHVAGLKISSG